MKITTDKLDFAVPLSFEAHSIAEKFSQGISNSQKAKQVYLNTLAVYAVNHYLQCMGFITDWEGSDSYDSLAVKLMDVADLKVGNIGKLECRPVLPGVEIMEIPPEVWEDRIGYIAVQFNSSLKEANIIGFTDKATEKTSLNQLQSLSDFLIYLSEKELSLEPVTVEQSSHLVKLGHWLGGLVDETWVEIDKILNPQQLGLSFRNTVSITRGQKIDLEMQLEKISFALVVKIDSTGEEEEELDILTQVYPVGKMVLPEEVELIVKDSNGETVLEVKSREDDNWIQQEFSVEKNEQFQIIVAYKESREVKVFEV